MLFPVGLHPFSQDPIRFRRCRPTPSGGECAAAPAGLWVRARQPQLVLRGMARSGVMRIAARMKMAHKLATIVIVLLLALSYVTIEYAVGLWSRINEHAMAEDGLHYFEGLKEAARARAAPSSFTPPALGGRTQSSVLQQQNQ